MAKAIWLQKPRFKRALTFGAKCKFLSYVFVLQLSTSNIENAAIGQNEEGNKNADRDTTSWNLMLV